MFVIRYTGKGWLALLLIITIGAACIVIASWLGLRGEAFLLTTAGLYTLIGAPLHWRIGRTINTPHQVHTFNGVPMEYTAIVYPAIALLAVAVLLGSKGYAAAMWTVGIATFVGVVVCAVLAHRHMVGLRMAATEEGLFLFGPPNGGLPQTREALAASDGWVYLQHAPQVLDRWRDSYGPEVDRLVAVRVLIGEQGGLPFTVFDIRVNAGSWRDRLESLRTVCLVQLPVSLPDVRLRGQLVDEKQYGQIPPVAYEPPWNCDTVPRLSALSLIESAGQGLPMVAESDVPEFAGALITEEVHRETLQRRIPGWRIHGSDLLFVSMPSAASSMSTHEALSAVAGLVAIARSLPGEVLHRYGRPAVSA